MKYKITFAIPTWNRIANLKENLQVLVPQLDQDCKLLILDNCSDNPVASAINEMVPSQRLFDFEIIRHPTNIGGNANIVRCFELCSTDWLFLIGDSKKVTSDLVVKLKRNIAQFPKTNFVNFYYPDKYHAVRDRLIVTKGRLSFVKEMGSFCHVILLGNSLINMRKIKTIEHGYHYCYSSAPQFVIPLMNMDDASECVLSPERVVDVFMEKPKEGVGVFYSMIECWIGFSAILDLPLEPTVRFELAKKISGASAPTQPYLWFFKSLLLLSVQPGKNQTARYYFHRVCSSRYYYCCSIIMRIKLLVTYVLLRLPFIVRILIGFNEKFIKRVFQRE